MKTAATRMFLIPSGNVRNASKVLDSIVNRLLTLNEDRWLVETICRNGKIPHYLNGGIYGGKAAHCYVGLTIYSGVPKKTANYICKLAEEVYNEVLR